VIAASVGRSYLGTSRRVLTAMTGRHAGRGGDWRAHQVAQQRVRRLQRDNQDDKTGDAAHTERVLLKADR
jgi:hypothetical protein